MLQAEGKRPRFLLALAALILGLPFVPPAGALQDQASTLRPKVRMATSLGDIVIELNAEKAPLTCMNFLRYAEDGYYDGTVFHRIKEYLIQGGMYLPDLSEKTAGLREAVINESRRGLFNERGTIAMFRVPFSPNSARSQFFINVKDNSSFDNLRDGYGYTVFGRVVDGLDVVDKIAKAETTSHPNYAAGRSAVVPKEPVVIKSITVLDKLDSLKAFDVAAEYEQRRKDPLTFRIRDLEKEHGKTARRLESGVVIIEIKEGTGGFPVEDDTAEIDFKSYLVDSIKPFDTTMDRLGRPQKMKVASLLPGLKEAVLGMREGGRWIVIVPPKLAFGEEGMPPKVPPNSTIIYDVELLGLSRDKPD